MRISYWGLCWYDLLSRQVPSPSCHSARSSLVASIVHSAPRAAPAACLAIEMRCSSQCCLAIVGTFRCTRKLGLQQALGPLGLGTHLSVSSPQSSWGASRCELTAESAWPMALAWNAQCLAVASLAELARTSQPVQKVQKALIQDTRTSPHTAWPAHLRGFRSGA